MASVFATVTELAATQPDACALLTEADGTRTYGELAAAAAAVAAGLQELGLGPGGRLCLWLVNHPTWIEAYLAASAIGVTVVALDPSWTDDEVVYALRQSEAAAVVCDSPHAARALGYRPDLPSLHTVIAVELDGEAAPAGAVRYADLVQTAALAVLPPEPATADDQTQILYTSGTTGGRPKGVVARLGVVGGTSYVEMFGLSAADRAIVVTPFFHANGLSGVTIALLHGASAVFARRFSATAFWPLVDRFRPTYLFTLSPIANILLSRPPSPLEGRHRMRVAVVAAGGGSNAAVVEQRFGFPVVDIYGMTEALGFGTYHRLDDRRRPGSSGRRAPGSPMTIVRADGSVAPPNEVGEVVYPLESIAFAGYLGDDEATAAVVRDGRLHTGDLGYFDEDGFFYFVERSKDVVRRGGENISSKEVEDELRLVAGISDAAVVGRPDPILGERVVAFVVTGGRRPDLDAVRAQLAEHLAPHKLPEELLVVDELPRTATGKVVKAELRRSLREGAGAPTEAR